MGGGFGHDAGIDRDGDHVPEHRDQTGDEGRDEQPFDVLFCKDRIDHKHHRRRDQDTQCPASGQSACRQRAGVARTLEFRQGDLAHGRCRCQRRSANRTEARGGPHCGHGQPALAVAQPRVGCVEQVAGHAATGGEFAHQQEQRDDGEGVVRQRPIKERLQLAVHQACVALDDEGAEEAHDEQRRGEGDAQEDQQQERGKAQQAQLEVGQEFHVLRAPNQCTGRAHDTEHCDKEKQAGQQFGHQVGGPEFDAKDLAFGPVLEPVEDFHPVAR